MTCPPTSFKSFRIRRRPSLLCYGMVLHDRFGTYLSAEQQGFIIPAVIGVMSQQQKTLGWREGGPLPPTRVRAQHVFLRTSQRARLRHQLLKAIACRCLADHQSERKLLRSSSTPPNFADGSFLPCSYDCAKGSLAFFALNADIRWCTFFKYLSGCYEKCTFTLLVQCNCALSQIDANLK